MGAGVALVKPISNKVPEVVCQRQDMKEIWIESPHEEDPRHYAAALAVLGVAS